MANAQVEKLKALGLRHGEKAVVGLASLICLVLLALAAVRPTIQLTPDEVTKDAKAAQQNLDNRQNPEDILKALEDQGIKEVGFAKLVDGQSKSTLVADGYKISQPWVTPEPGAGLIRDTPALLAPTELVAYPGRGGTSVFELDENGKRILEDPEKKAEEDASTKQRRTGKRNRSMMASYASMMGAGPGMGMYGPGEQTEEAKKAAARKAAQLKRLLGGREKPEREKAKEKGKEGEEPVELTPEDMGPWKEKTQGVRWVSIIGVLDHKTLRDNYLTALKNPSIAHPNYKQVDVQRQWLQHDGSWSDWEVVDIEKNREVLFNLPETEEELASEDTIVENLVAPLPFLKAGLWEKVHVVSLVPKERKEIPKTGFGGMAGPGMPGMEGMPGPGMPGMMGRGGAGMAGMYGRGAMMEGMAGPGMPGMPGMAGMGMSFGGGEENQNFQKTEAETVMIRALDFTVEPDTTYRFRLRVVVFNPNYNREDVNPGVDTKSEQLEGPWSEPTAVVTMPADVTTYAMQKTPAAGTAKRTDQVTFQVTRWNPEDGVTVVRNFTAGPGEVIGEPATAAIPASDGTGAKNKSIDFNSHHIVIDTAGGSRAIAQLGAAGAPLDVPAVSLLMRPDGVVVLRKQVNDLPDEVRKDMADNYAREVKESTTNRQNSLGGEYGPGMPGMGGGGMPGMGGGMRR